MAMTTKLRAVALGGAICLLISGCLFGYQYFFTKGLDRLPAEVCSGAVERATVVSALPDAREAHDGESQTAPGEDFLFACRVTTSNDSIISGESEVSDSSIASWTRHFEGKGDSKVMKVSSGNVQALTVSDLATIYVPCTPPDKNPTEAVQSYALVTQARVIGASRVQGVALRQALTDFSFQMTKHAYKIGKCKEAERFPAKLPAIKSTP